MPVSRLVAAAASVTQEGSTSAARATGVALPAQQRPDDAAPTGG